ncbi:DUF982 domain-containing protein, partial [Rhizobium ruizarguesonis]
MIFDMLRNFPTIILVFAEGKDLRVIRTAREAAQLLLKEWPIDEIEMARAVGRKLDGNLRAQAAASDNDEVDFAK